MIIHILTKGKFQQQARIFHNKDDVTLPKYLVLDRYFGLTEEMHYNLYSIDIMSSN